MPAIISVEEAQTRLKELIDKLAPGEEIVLTENQQRVAKLVGERLARPPRPAPGLGKGSILYMAPDFDEALDEFKEYLE
jgi:antitoxin (DNA-binding transcriptional repressor) of toxin-antitoxin stability system